MDTLTIHQRVERLESHVFGNQDAIRAEVRAYVAPVLEHLMAGYGPLATKDDLKALEAKMDTRFDAMDARFDAMDARFDAMETRMDTRMDKMDERMDKMDLRMDSMDSKLDMILAKLDGH